MQARELLKLINLPTLSSLSNVNRLLSFYLPFLWQTFQLQLSLRTACETTFNFLKGDDNGSIVTFNSDNLKWSFLNLFEGKPHLPVIFKYFFTTSFPFSGNLPFSEKFHHIKSLDYTVLQTSNAGLLPLQWKEPNTVICKSIFYKVKYKWNSNIKCNY